MKKSYLFLILLPLIQFCSKNDLSKKQNSDLSKLYILSSITSPTCQEKPIEESTGTLEDVNSTVTYTKSCKIFSGNIFCDNGSYIEKTNLSSFSKSTFAGSTTTGDTDATGENARFTKIFGITIDKSGNIFLADQVDSSCKIKKITSAGVVTTLGTFTNSCGSNVDIDDSGKLYLLRRPSGTNLISFYDTVNNTSGTTKTLSTSFLTIQNISVNTTGTEFLISYDLGGGYKITSSSETKYSGYRVFGPNNIIFTNYLKSGVDYGSVGKIDSNENTTNLLNSVTSNYCNPKYYLRNSSSNKNPFVFDSSNSSVFYYLPYKITLK